MINDPLGIVDKILEFAENFSMSLPSCDRGTVLSLCLALGVKSGRLSILLQTIWSLVSDEEMLVDIDIDLIKDITNSLKIKAELEIKNNAQTISSNESNESIKDNSLGNFNIKKEGLVLSFGKADQGKLGHGDIQLNRLVPTLIENLQTIGITKVASMSTNVIAIDSNGSAYVWGAGSGGSPNTLHGLRSEIYPVILEYLPPKSIVVDISCGLAHSLFLLDSGRVLSRGNGSNGRLGLGDCSDRVEASFVSILSNDFITSVQCGACHSLALNVKGELYCWGKNTQGQCGVGNIEDVLIPALNKTFQNIPLFIVELAAGWEHSACITKDGNLYTWGCGYKDSRRGVIPPVLGQGNNEGKLSPELVSSIDGVKVSKITCGWDHCLALDVKGKVLSWGSGQNGKLGHGNEENISIPCYIPSLEGLNIVSISAGSEHSAAISDTGTVYTWGHGDGGRLGHGDNLQYLLPSPVISLGVFNAW
jgi:alpha-tubulin suppressor-like RCC1 family protein